MVRVRYAPSPTGNLHIGNARTAIFNYLFAKKHNGKFIVRVEDTDTERNTKGGEDSQLKFLKWLGVDWDESVDNPGDYGPYRQLERLDIYKEYCEKLLSMGLAYKCYCTSEELINERVALKASGANNIFYSKKCYNLSDEEKKSKEGLPYTVRISVPENTEYTFDDLVKGSVTFKSEDIGDWVIMKNNGIPTYNFACVIDDHLMEMTHVLRGEDHITNTPKQMMIYEALGWEPPIFGHMTLIVNDQGKKLSKRDENILQFIEQYSNLGFLPDALFNFIGLLGWSPANSEEIISHDEFIKIFDENRLSKSPAKFDKDKLAYINNCYVKELTNSETVELVKPFLISEGILDGKSDLWCEKLVSLFHDRLSYGAQIVDEYYDAFTYSEYTDECDEFMNQDGIFETVLEFKRLLIELDDWVSDEIFACLKQAGKNTNAKGKMLYMPIRIATTGKMHGPDLPKILELLGKETVIAILSK